MRDTVFPTPKMKHRLARLWDDLLAEPVPPRPAATEREPAVLGHDEGAERVSRNWRADFVTWIHHLVELEDGGSTSTSTNEQNSEPSPFRWEPTRVGTSSPFRSGRPFSISTDPRRSSRGSKIPIRPLHKQPFYRRFFFYLRRWLSSSIWQESNPVA